jgi:hypothetical protein
LLFVFQKVANGQLYYLAGVVISTQFGDQVGRVLSRVDGQGLGDDQQSLRKFSDRELLSGNRKDRVKLQIRTNLKLRRTTR